MFWRTVQSIFHISSAFRRTKFCKPFLAAQLTFSRTVVDLIKDDGRSIAASPFLTLQTEGLSTLFGRVL